MLSRGVFIYTCMDIVVICSINLCVWKALLEQIKHTPHTRTHTHQRILLHKFKHVFISRTHIISSNSGLLNTHTHMHTHIWYAGDDSKGLREMYKINGKTRCKIASFEFQMMETNKCLIRFLAEFRFAKRKFKAGSNSNETKQKVVYRTEWSSRCSGNINNVKKSDEKCTKATCEYNLTQWVSW